MPDNTLNCVVFLGAKSRTGPHYRGTAFFVSVPSDDQRLHYVYLVTAKHNLDRAAQESPDRTILIRPTWADPKRSGSIETSRAEWADHSDADVAILDFDVTSLRYSALDINMLVTDELRRQDDIGVGDELQVTGLFIHHRGIRRNVPIVRSGIIAAMPDPDEPVVTQIGEMEAYLAEVRSLGGLSGSPVFVVLPPFRRKTSAPSHEARAYLLGLVSAHWDQKVPTEDYPDPVDAEKINQGIAAIVPATKILELIDAPTEKERRRATPDHEVAKRVHHDVGNAAGPYTKGSITGCDRPAPTQVPLAYLARDLGARRGCEFQISSDVKEMTDPETRSGDPVRG